MDRNKYLEEIEKVIADGPFKDNWESLSNYKIPQWYKNAKFGIFTHWGVYSVPAYGDEWYPRHMYNVGSPYYEHHIKTYGKQKDFGYADFIPLFTAEKFNPKEWLDLIEESGAKYYIPVAEHHDGFQMYKSDLSKWNAYEMGPKRDIIQELKEETESRGLHFCVSSHRAENYWFMCGGKDFDSGINETEFLEPYGFAKKLFENEDRFEYTHDIFVEGANEAHLEDWLLRACELVDKFKPSVVWFDWWIQNLSFKPYLKKFAAYYYNRAKSWDMEVAINYKDDAFALGTAVYDIERALLASIRPDFWQTDTAVAKNSWSHTEGNEYKTAESLVCDLIDVVSKNGAMLLNIGPKADGTIPKEDKDILKAIGAWLKVNGESIFDTNYWSTFGEGPTEVVEGDFNDVAKEDYTSKDIRFTYKAPYVYANLLKFPGDNKTLIKSFAKKLNHFKGTVKNVEILGSDAPLNYALTTDGLSVEFNEKIDTTYPVCLKITID